MASPDEFDQFFDDSLPWEEIGKLVDAASQAPPPTLPQASTSKPTLSRHPSGQQRTQHKPILNEFKSAATFLPPTPQVRKRARQPEVDSPRSALKKMKLHARKVLREFDEDFTCPICFDLIVGCHMTNPCGHSACGACARTWASTKSRPTCFACRSPMNRAAPIIPGLLIDNLIEKHINSLADNGDDDWAEGGSKRKEYEERKTAWAKKKARFELIRKAMNQPTEVVSVSSSSDEEGEDEEDEDDDDDSEDDDDEDPEPEEVVRPERLDSFFPQVTRELLARLPVPDDPHDEDYVPATQIEESQQEPGGRRPSTRRSRTGGQ